MPVLDKLVIATMGTLPHDLKNIKNWIDKNGGKHSANVRKGVTHLIASKEAWKTAAAPIQQATRMGIPVVSYDWFDDSLQSKRKLGTKKYTWEVIRRERKKKKQLKRLGTTADSKKFRAGCERIREFTGSGTSVVTRKPKKSKSFFFATSAPVIPDTPFVSATEDLKRRRAEREAALADSCGASGAPIEIEDEPLNQANPSSSSSTPKPISPAKSSLTKATSPSSKKPATPKKGTQAKTSHWKDLYHYYQDATGFEYKILLIRNDAATNSMAQYHLGLLESHMKPHTYWALVQYKPKVAAPPPPPSDTNVPEKKSTMPVHSLSAPEEAVVPVYDPLAHEARLRALIQPPVPVEDKPYNSELCPRGSDYFTASRVFRHAFRDLTLLSWEERFDTDKALQKARAQHLNIEPFYYAKPSPGMPMGLLPQEHGMLCGDATDLKVRGDIEDGYVRGKLGLPAIDEPLGTTGLVGGAIHSDKQAVRKREETRLRRVEEREKEERRKRGEVLVKEKKINHNKPMFNGPMGKPGVEYGNAGTGGWGASSGRGFVAPEFAHLVKKMKPFMGGSQGWMG